MKTSGLPLRTLADVWTNCVAQWPRKVGAIFEDREYTYAELDTTIGRLAAAMRDRLGIGAGDRVCIAMPNRIEFLYVYWATIRLGATVVPINFRMEARGVNFILRETEAKALFVHQEA